MYKLENLDFEGFDLNFLAEKKLTQCIIYNIDSLEYGSTTKLNINLDNILEARFFNEDSELKIIREDNGFNIIYLEDNNESTTDSNSFYYRTYILDKKAEEFGKIKVKNYIDYDEDGQAYLKYMRPYSFVKEDK